MRSDDAAMPPPITNPQSFAVTSHPMGQANHFQKTHTARAVSEFARERVEPSPKT